LKIPEGIRENFLRADSGFYDGDFLEYLEMMDTGIGWKAPRRIVVIREEQRENKGKKKQPTLFELIGYSYRVIVTNIEDMSPEVVWRFYNRRANVENMIKE
jgi:DDE family transposase